MSLWWDYAAPCIKFAHVLTFESGGRIIGIAPFYKTLSLRGVSTYLMGKGISDRLGYLCDPQFENEFMQEISSWLTKQHHIDLHQITEDNPLNKELKLYSEKFQSLEHAKCSFIDLPNSWEEYVATLGEKTRFNAGYSLRKLKKDFDCVEINISDKKTLDDDLESLFDLHNKRWYGSNKKGSLFCKESMREIHRQWAVIALKNNWLKLHTLKVNNKIVAITYVFHFQKTAYFYLTAYDTSFHSKYSLGTVLLAESIKTAIKDECTKFDFLRGEESYKLKWANNVRKHFRWSSK